MARSPGVFYTERDESFGVPAVATSVGAIVLNSDRGPIGPTIVTSGRRFLELFDEPTEDTPAKHTALEFLKESSQLYVKRAVVDAETAEKEIDSKEEEEPTFTVKAENPGEWGNHVSVKFTQSDRQKEDNRFTINVYYDDDLLEDIEVSLDPDAKDGFGKSLYIEEKVKNLSETIRVEDDPSVDDDPVFDQMFELEGGSDDTESPGDSELIDAAQWMRNREKYSINYIINAGFTAEPYQNELVDIAEDRADTLAILDMPEDDVTSDNIIEYNNEDLNVNSSYACIYAGWPQIYDQYNDREIYVPPSGFAARVMAHTANVGEVWYAPAGVRRGIINVLGVKEVFDKGTRDAIYGENVNMIQEFVGEGVQVWGQKTLQRQASALDRINVRLLMNFIRVSLEEALRPYVFQLNTEFERNNVTSLIENFLEDIMQRNGLYDYNVICDSSNNTGQVIDRNELIADIYLKPVRVAEFIKLNAVITPTDADIR